MISGIQNVIDVNNTEKLMDQLEITPESDKFEINESGVKDQHAYLSL